MPTDVLAIVRAGGEGKRLMPLTEDRAKHAVPYGGLYRLIDFPLSNLANAGILRMVVRSGVCAVSVLQVWAAHGPSLQPGSHRWVLG